MMVAIEIHHDDSYVRYEASTHDELDELVRRYEKDLPAGLGKPAADTPTVVTGGQS